MNNLCYTIGYNKMTLAEFIDVLRKNQINCVIDVRIVCGDGEYDIKNLKYSLNQTGIYYIFMGQEFALSKEASDLEAADKNENIHNGINRILNGVRKGYNIALISQQPNAFKDIRGILISRLLQKRGIKVLHIVENNAIRTQADLEEEMLKGYGPKLVKKVAELSIKGIMNNKTLDMDESDFKTEMINEAYNMRFNEICSKSGIVD